MVKNKVVIERKRCMDQFGEFHWWNGGKVCRSNGTGSITESGLLSSHEENKTVVQGII